MKNSEHPKLDPPGAGLPIPQRWIARILAPLKAKRTPWEESTELFNRTTEKILNVVAPGGVPLSEEKLNQRVLIDPIQGLEDSSRYWSVGMTLDHLLIVIEGFKTIIVSTSHGKKIPFLVKTENVKPPEYRHTAETIEKFRAASTSLMKEIDQQVGDRNSKVTAAHPWFGEFNPHQWHWITAIHQTIHYKQIKAILRAF